MMSELTNVILILFFCCCMSWNACNPSVPELDNISKARNYLSDVEAINADSTVNVVIEIPAGTTAKWEVNKKDGALRHEIKNGKPRMVQYLGYPANYGMIPKTKLPKALGGDGDPLDVIVLGESIPRGEVVAVKIIGMLNLLDGGEQDDKLITVAKNTPFEHIQNINELYKQYHGILEILETWFTNYKGKNILEAKGFSDKKEAQKVLTDAIDAYHKSPY